MWVRERCVRCALFVWHKRDMVGVPGICFCHTATFWVQCFNKNKTFAFVHLLSLYCCLAIFQTRCTIGGKESMVCNTVPTNSSLPNCSKTSGPFLQNSKSNFGSLMGDLAADRPAWRRWAYLGLWQSSSQLQMISPTLARSIWAVQCSSQQSRSLCSPLVHNYVHMWYSCTCTLFFTVQKPQ